MNYELAKKLKEAGFPQKGFWFYGSNETDTPCLTYDTNPYDTCAIQMIGDADVVMKYPRKVVLCYAPTLSELIEACGDGFQKLEREVGKDTGRIIFGAYSTTGFMQWGETLEEAVANLWLKLNSK